MRDNNNMAELHVRVPDPENWVLVHLKTGSKYTFQEGEDRNSWVREDIGVDLETAEADLKEQLAELEAVRKLVGKGWRVIPPEAYDEMGTIEAFVAGRNSVIDRIRSIVNPTEVDLVTGLHLDVSDIAPDPDLGEAL